MSFLMASVCPTALPGWSRIEFGVGSMMRLPREGRMGVPSYLERDQSPEREVGG